MPETNFDNQIQPTICDIACSSFLQTGEFSLTNGIISTEELNGCIKFLKQLTRVLNFQDPKLYLKNITFDVGPVEPETLKRSRDQKVFRLINQLFRFYSSWSVIALDNITILQEGNRYPLSSFCLLKFLTPLTASMHDNSRVSITQQLIIKNAEFHSWGWIEYLIRRPRFHTLVLELINDTELEDNLMLLFQALHYAKINVLEIKNTGLSLECYQALNELLSKNYYLEQLEVNEPTNPESLILYNDIKQRLAAGGTGKQRFDRERFNQAEFLRLFNEAKTALQYETDEDKIKLLKKQFKFMLEQKKRQGNLIAREGITFTSIPLTPKTHTVYYDHAEYIVGRLPLFRLNLNRSVDNRVNTLGYYLLEEALISNDHFMMNCLLDNGTANLFEQQAEGKPILMQIFENTDFKQVILEHIYSRRNLISMAEEVLENYSESKKLMVELGYSLINYTQRLEKIIYSYKLSGFERLLNQLRERFNLSNPSKQREREFIEIYWRIGKSLILFHNAGEVTMESVSNAQTTLDEIIAISEHADFGWLRGSKLHDQLAQRLDRLKKVMGEDTKSLKDKHKSTEKTFNNAFFTNSNLKEQHSEASRVDEPEPSTSFSPRPS